MYCDTDDAVLGEEDAEDYCISDVLKRKNSRMFYTYDFGDNWEHEIILEDKDYDYSGNGSEVLCIEGARACPPEDCGGVWGYSDLCEIIADPKHEEYQSMMDWLGDDGFDPEKFDFIDINNKMRILNARYQNDELYDDHVDDDI